MSLFSLENKMALVTGPAKGLGKSMTLGLAEAGADIVGVGIDSMDEVAKEVTALGRKFYPISFNLLKTNEIPQMVEDVLKDHGHIDILLNNAGVTPKGLAETYTEENFDLAMNLNVKALFRLTQEVGKSMIKANYGKIINVCSIQSIIGGTNVSAYVASKHAVAGITRSFSNEWGKYGIRVNGIAPGFMVTDNTKELRENHTLVDRIDARIPLQRWGTPEDLKGTVIFLASAASDYMSGQLLVLDGGYLNN